MRQMAKEFVLIQYLLTKTSGTNLSTDVNKVAPKYVV